MGEDFWPYGFNENLHTLKTFLRYHHDQGISRRLVRPEELFAESTFAKQIAMIEKNLIPPVVKVGNLQSLRTVADVRDAVRAYYMLVTVNPVAGAYYNDEKIDTYSLSVIVELLPAPNRLSGTISDPSAFVMRSSCSAMT